MAFFLRFTETPKADLKRGYSHHFFGTDESFIEDLDNVEWVEGLGQYAEELDGLCGYELDSDSLEDALEEVEDMQNNPFKDCFSWKSDSWSIYEGEYIDDCPEGSVFKAASILHTNRSASFAE